MTHPDPEIAPRSASSTHPTRRLSSRRHLPARAAPTWPRSVVPVPPVRRSPRDPGARHALTSPPPQVWDAHPARARGAAAPARSRRCPARAPPPEPAYPGVVVAASVGRGLRPRRLGGRPGRTRPTSSAAQAHVRRPSSRWTGSRHERDLSHDRHHRRASRCRSTCATSTRAHGFLEVWLLDAKTGGMVSLGVLDGDHGSCAVPSGPRPGGLRPGRRLPRAVRRRPGALRGQPGPRPRPLTGSLLRYVVSGPARTLGPICPTRPTPCLTCRPSTSTTPRPRRCSRPRSR